MAVNDLIKNLKDGDNVNANKEFDSLMADKITASLDAKKIELASTMAERKKEEE
jgi:hypothetical protein